MKGETFDILGECAGAGIMPVFTVETILPVYHSVRGAGALTFGQVSGTPNSRRMEYDQAMEKVERNRAYRKLRQCLEGFGLKVRYGFEPSIGSGALSGKFYVFRGDGKGIDKINKLFKVSYEAIMEGRYALEHREALVRDAALFGYPERCAALYADDVEREAERLVAEGTLGRGKRLARTGGPERRARLQLSDAAGAAVNDEDGYPKNVRSLPLETLSSYFTLYFFPSEPGCEEASKIGMKTIEAFREKDPELADIYRDIALPANALIVWSRDSEHVHYASEMVDHRMFSYVIEQMGAQTGDDTEGRGPDVKNGKTGRNEPCPCGSGMKFKKCCGNC